MKARLNILWSDAAGPYAEAVCLSNSNKARACFDIDGSRESMRTRGETFLQRAVLDLDHLCGHHHNQIIWEREPPVAPTQFGRKE